MNDAENRTIVLKNETVEIVASGWRLRYQEIEKEIKKSPPGSRPGGLCIAVT